jgi:hypothetical protein
MSSAPATSITYASAGLMVGKPDPMMTPGFPKDTAFTPYLVVRNTTEKPLDVSMQLNYMMGMQASAPVTRNLPAQHLGPREVRQVDMQAALNSAGVKDFNGSINLSVSFTGKTGDLGIASGSVDQTGTYVFEVKPQGISSSRSKFTNYWGVSNGNDTMFTLWNPTGQPEDILATFYYGDGSGKYVLPVHLEAQASTMIDMGMLIAEIKPDANGNVIPPSIQEGSAQFASAKGSGEKITLVVAGGLYNVSTATCGEQCTNCCGDSNFNISPGTILCPIGEGMQLLSTATDCYGNTVVPVSFSSDNTSVMTVDAYGYVNGVAVGTANITAYWGNEVVYNGQFCVSDDMNDSCPTNNEQATNGADVISATISQNTSGQVSSDDAAGSNYQTAEGTTSLGPIIGNGTSQGCFIGFETVGTISPSTFTGNVILHRTIDGDATYTNSTSTGGAQPGTDDTSNPALRDDDPQSGGSNGKVYDLDAPGVTNIPVDGNTYRIRTNFHAYAALPGGTVVSSQNYNFYIRVSCKKTSSGYQFANDVPGDNQIGSGTTKTSWNLQ